MKSRTEQKRCCFRFSKTMLDHLGIAGTVEQKTMSEIVRASVGVYLDDFYNRKRSELIKRRHDFNDIENMSADDDWDTGSFMMRS